MNTIFTAIFSNYDDLKEPRVITPGWQYIVFTDQELKSNVWKIVKCDLLPEGSRFTARYYKLMYHKHIISNRSIWCDASFLINCNLDEFWNKNFIKPFSAPKHPIRSCVYQEAEACIKNKRADEKSVQDQIDKYSKLGVHRNNGMISSGILMRELNELTIAFCFNWWKELRENSIRDQIAFAKIAQDSPNVCKSFVWDYRDNDDFIFISHLFKRTVSQDIAIKAGDIIRRRRRARRTNNRF